MKAMEIEVEGETVELLPERALWWPLQKAIILSDVHWGKSAHFRKNGIAMPGKVQDTDSKRLAALVSKYNPERLIIAGDLFHSRHNKEVDDFGIWRKAHASLHIDFIIGNHDILPTNFYSAMQLSIHVEGLLMKPFYIAHDVTQDAQHFTLHGHIHPGVRIGSIGTLPAFCVNKTCMVLPAFGTFTGCKTVNIGDYNRIFVIGEGKVLPLKA